MVTTVLVLAAALAGPARPTPLIPLDRSAMVAPLPWNECGTEPPDWREPRPLVVLTDDQRLAGHQSVPGMGSTAFALYDDGTAFIRDMRGGHFGLRRSKLSIRPPARRGRRRGRTAVNPLAHADGDADADGRNLDRTRHPTRRLRAVDC